MSFLRLLRSLFVTVCVYLLVGFFLINFFPNFFNLISTIEFTGYLLLLWFSCGAAFNFEVGELTSDKHAPVSGAVNYLLYGTLAIAAGPFGFLLSDRCMKKY